MKSKEKMTNFERVKKVLTDYLEAHSVHDYDFITSFKCASKNDSGGVYLYNGKTDREVISMDLFAKHGYKVAKGVTETYYSINTVDAFFVDLLNQWYLIEFKDSQVLGNDKLKDNLDKKAFANVLMLLDVLFERKTMIELDLFNCTDPIRFIREHFIYVLVCSAEKNWDVEAKIRENISAGVKYTPPCMYKFKEYFFKDAYAYTEFYFEEEFVKKIAF